MKKTIMLSMLSIAFTGISFVTMAQTTNKEEDLIRNTVKTVETGWMEKSGEKYASSFAEVHDFIVWNGYYFPNSTRQATAAGHQGLFNSIFKNLDIKLKVDKIKFVRPDIAMVHILGAMYEKGKAIPENPGVIMTMLMEKIAGTWQIICFQNLDLESFQNKEIADNSPMPLNIMYAGWYKK
ncbi:MAG: SgcJ/EcaC family oxidoreductase [Ferruginibacter sp.]